jgi:hypothetical protein
MKNQRRFAPEGGRIESESVAGFIGISRYGDFLPDRHLIPIIPCSIILIISLEAYIHAFLPVDPNILPLYAQTTINEWLGMDST